MRIPEPTAITSTFVIGPTSSKSIHPILPARVLTQTPVLHSNNVFCIAVLACCSSYSASAASSLAWAAATDNRSQRSFSGCPACPCTQTNSTSCFAQRVSSRSHRSVLTAYSLRFRFQPFARQRCAQPFMMASTRIGITRERDPARIFQRRERCEGCQDLHAVVHR